MRIWSWLFGKPTPSPTASVEQPERNGEAREQPAASPAENLRRWRASGQAKAWVEARQGQWDHAAWLALLDDLKQSAFWPMDVNDVGLALEESKREWLHRQRN